LLKPLDQICAQSLKTIFWKISDFNERNGKIALQCLDLKSTHKSVQMNA